MYFKNKCKGIKKTIVYIYYYSTLKNRQIYNCIYFLVKRIDELQNIKRIYNLLKVDFNRKSFNYFLNTLKYYKKDINDIYIKFGNFGISKNADIQEYLDEYQNIACLFDNITYLSNEHMIRESFNNLNKSINEVESKYENYIKSK